MPRVQPPYIFNKERVVCLADSGQILISHHIMEFSLSTERNPSTSGWNPTLELSKPDDK